MRLGLQGDSGDNTRPVIHITLCGRLKDLFLNMLLGNLVKVLQIGGRQIFPLGVPFPTLLAISTVLLQSLLSIVVNPRVRPVGTFYNVCAINEF